MTEINRIINDLEILCAATERDLGSETNFAAAPGHVDQFNELLLKAQELGNGSEIKEIPPLPPGSTRLVSQNVVKGMATIGEVNSKAKRLLSRLKEKQTKQEQVASPVSTIENIASRFHDVVRQLQHRHDRRETLNVKDEYDVQDLMHALLRLFFDDIRPEEGTPSHAGAASRMDFLLKNEEIVIETKMARETLNAKKLGDELIVDIKRYENHPNCKTLLCLVYDPMKLIPNPRGIEADLSKETDGLLVIVLIVPY